MKSVEGEKLKALAYEGREVFESAAPFPHIVLDDFLNPAAAEEILKEFHIPPQKAILYDHYNNHSLGFNQTEKMGPATQNLFQDLQSPEFVRFLEGLTGISCLRPDPDLDGAGLHEAKRGGYLNMHVDFLAHTLRRSLSRQLNFILYLNKEWKEEYNGYLEFWDKGVKRRFQKIKPAFNRVVIFKTGRNSFHGYPAPLLCPPEQSRKTIALYYYREENKPCPLEPTFYQYVPSDPLTRKAFIVLDRLLLAGYSFLKRHSLVSDQLISKIVRLYK